MRKKDNMPPNKNLTFQFEENALGAVFDVQNITSKNSSLTHVKDTIHDTCNVDSHDGNFARAAKDIQVWKPGVSVLVQFFSGLVWPNEHLRDFR